MANPQDYDDENDDPPQEWDAEEDSSADEPDMIACPNCRKMILEDAERCPKCGHYITAEDQASIPSQPRWVIITAILLIIAFALFWIF